MAGSRDMAKLPGMLLQEFITATMQKKARCGDIWSMRKKEFLVQGSLALEIQFYSSTDAEPV